MTAEYRGGLWDTLIRLPGLVRAAHRRGVNYTTKLIWLVGHTIERHRSKVLDVLALGQLSFAAKAAALGVLYWYGAQTQADAVVSFEPLGIELRAREDLLVLWAVAGTSAMCFLGSSFLLYLSENAAVGVGEESLARRLSDVVRVARRLPDPRAPAASRILIEQGVSSVNRGCRYGATSTVMLLGAVTPLVSGIAAGVVLVVIDPVLTTLLAVAAIFWSLLLYPLTRQQVRIAGRTARGKAAFARESRELIDSPDEIGSDGNLGSAATLAAVVIGRRRIANRIKLVLQIGVATIGTVAAVYLAYRIMGGIGDWPIFIVYLGGLRIALNGCFAVPRTIGMVTRHYPRVVVYIEFLQDSAAIDAGGLGHIGPGDVATLGSLSDGTPVCARAGDLVAVAALEGASAVQAAFLGARAAATGLPLAATWVEVAAPPRQVSANYPIRLTEAQPMAEMDRPEVHAFVDYLKDGVTAIVHRDEARIGAFGETHLIVVDAGKLTTSVPLGTAESRAALESFADRRERYADEMARADLDSNLFLADDEEEDA